MISVANTPSTYVNFRRKLLRDGKLTNRVYLSICSILSWSSNNFWDITVTPQSGSYRALPIRIKIEFDKDKAIEFSKHVIETKLNCHVEQVSGHVDHAEAAIKMIKQRVRVKNSSLVYDTNGDDSCMISLYIFRSSDPTCAFLSIDICVQFRASFNRDGCDSASLLHTLPVLSVDYLFV